MNTVSEVVVVHYISLCSLILPNSSGSIFHIMRCYKFIDSFTYERVEEFMDSM